MHTQHTHTHTHTTTIMALITALHSLTHYQYQQNDARFIINTTRVTTNSCDISNKYEHYIGADL